MLSGTISLIQGRAHIDTQARLLTVGGAPARLGGRAFDLLLALVERHDRVVSKRELMDLVWPGLVVEEGNLHVHVFTLRRLLGADAIVTVPGRGYRFTAAVDAGRDGTRLPCPAGDESPALVGRDELLRQLTGCLADPGCRLLTLAGPGGAGKSRLALELAARVAAPGRAVHVVLLAPVRDDAGVMKAIAASMGLQEAGAQSTQVQVLDGLRRQAALLVLDNLEHLSGAARQVADLLRAAPGLQVLATSRSWLGLREELVVTVPPLALPAGAAMQDIVSSPAVALFAGWAARHGRPLEDNDDDRRAAAEICCRLDGLPLAIELVAPRLRVMTPPVLAVRLQRRLDLASSGAADALPHHRSLRQALDWSHDLLDQRARSLFRRLGLFVGGWSLGAADAMTDAIAGDAAGAWRSLETLLQHHLVQRLPDVGAEPRFAMLETIREYALEALVASGEGATCEPLRAAWMADWLEALQLRFDQGQRLQALASYRAERGNVREVLRWAFDVSGDRLLQARLVTRLVEAWYYDNDAEAGEAWFLRLDTAALLGSVRAHVLLVGANLANHRCCFDLAAQRAQQAAAQAGADGDRRTEALAWCQQGKACSDPDAAMALLRLGLQQLERLGEPGDTALATWWLGKRLAQEGGRDAEAQQALSLAHQRLLAVGDRWIAGAALIQLAALAARRGDRLQAWRHLDQGEAIALEHDDSVNVAAATHLRARFDLADGRIGDALQLEQRVLQLLLAEDETRIAVQHCRWLAHLHELRGEHEAAVRLMAASAGCCGDEGFLSLSTVSADDRADWLRAAQALRKAVPPAAHDRWWQEAQPWSPRQALALSESLRAGPD